MAVGDAHVLVGCMWFNGTLTANVITWRSLTHMSWLVVWDLAPL